MLSLCEAQSGMFDEINLSTALHRIAKLAPSLPSVAEGTAMRDLLGRARRTAHACGPQSLSNIAWSVATLGCADAPLL